MKAGRRSLLWVAALSIAAASASAEPVRWGASWAAPPAPPSKAVPNLPTSFITPSFRNQTIVQVVRLSRGGRALRLRLTNEYGTEPLRIGAAQIALVDEAGKVIEQTRRRVTFAGAREALVPAGAPWVSDPVALSVPDRARVQIALYLPDDTGPCTCHAMASATGLASPPGDYTDRPFAPAGTFSARAFVSEVDVATSAAPHVVVAFGDSITDGYQSSADTDRRWPDQLVRRLATRGRAAIAVANEGLSGNRILLDGVPALFGQSAVARFDRDVLAVPGVSTVIVLLGINDIGQKRPTPVTAAEIIAGYRQLIDRAHAKGLRIVGGTMLPYEGAPYYRVEGDKVRAAVNDWIRTARAFDAVIDFDRAMRDPARPVRLRPELQSGDWLHPNDAGYKVMADAVDASVLR